MLHPLRTIMRRGASRTATAPLLVALLLAACDDTTTAPPSEIAGEPLAAAQNSGAVVNTQVINIPAIDPTNEGHAIALPDIQGSVTARCLNRGTQLNVHMSGLRPHGVYTIWVVQFQSPGFDGTFANLIGVGSLGGQTPSVPNDGYRNVFTASASGEGQITRIHPPGDLSMFGAAGDCLIDPNQLFELHVVGNYHSDGQTQGAFPAPPGQGFDEFAFIFVN